MKDNKVNKNDSMCDKDDNSVKDETYESSKDDFDDNNSEKDAGYSDSDKPRQEKENGHHYGVKLGNSLLVSKCANVEILMIKKKLYHKVHLLTG